MAAKDNWISVRVEKDLKKRVENIAKRDRRKYNDQLLYLIEQGLELVEAGAGAKKA